MPNNVVIARHYYPSSGLLLWNDAKSGVKRSGNFQSSPNVVPNFERVISRRHDEAISSFLAKLLTKMSDYVKFLKKQRA